MGEALDFKTTVCAAQILPIEIGPLQCSKKIGENPTLTVHFFLDFPPFFKKELFPFVRQISSFSKTLYPYSALSDLQKQTLKRDTRRRPDHTSPPGLMSA